MHPLGPAHKPPAQWSEYRLLLFDITHENRLAAAADKPPQGSARLIYAGPWFHACLCCSPHRCW